MRFLSETEGKIYLSDVPSLTVSGWIGLILNYIILICWAVIILWPIYHLIKASFNTFSKETINTDNFEFSFSNFKYLFAETYYGQWLQNSIIVASLTMIFTVIVISLIGYAFSRFRFRGKRSGLMAIMLLQMIPTFTAIIAFYVIFQLLKEGVNMPPLVVMTIIYTGGGIAGNTFVLKGYLDNISSEIDDAARIDGCGNWKIYLQIIIPLARPMLAIIALWSFIGPFGDIILPQLLLPSVENYTVASGLNTLISNPNNMAQGAYAAGALIIGLPITILFIALQKNITGGLSAAGVKG
ncbi:ABC transporter permease subunit [Spiroplasma sp. SV19]|nr:ABC transporter permease subunit [Spiroplasma sp. SV19]